MSTAKIFDAEEQTFVRQVNKFYLSLSLAKICAKSCGLLKSDFAGSVLNKKEGDCISLCVNNIAKTQSSFFEKTMVAMKLPPVEDDGEEEEEE